MRFLTSRQVEADSRGRVTLGSRFADQELQIAIEDEIDVENLPVYFARHQVTLSERGVAELMGENRFGIDWDVGPITHASAYEPYGEGAVKDINAMNSIRETGALVCGVYKPVTDRIVRLGIVPPFAEIESRPYDSEDEGVTHIKSHKMENVIEVSKDEAPELFEGRPRGSVRKWPSKEDEVRRHYKG